MATPKLTNRPLPAAVATWAITLGYNQELDYGHIHEILHRDIAIGNDYRKERIKLLITLAAGVFALTVTFHKDLFGSTLTGAGLCFLLSGWAMMILSLWAGIVHFRRWEDFYLEYRAQWSALWRYHVAVSLADAHEQNAACDSYWATEGNIDGFQKSYRKWNRIQSISLILGMLLIAVYAGITGSAALHNAQLGARAASVHGSTVASDPAKPTPTNHGALPGSNGAATTTGRGAGATKPGTP